MADWYYSRGGQQQGPVPEATFIQWVQAGNVGATDLVWRDGMGAWVPLSTVPELAGYMPGGGQPAAGGYGQQPYPGQQPYGGQQSYSGQQPYPGQPLQYGTAPSTYVPQHPSQNLPYDDGGKRFVAALIDGLVLLAIQFPIALAMGVGVGLAAGGRPGAQMTVRGIGTIIGWLYFALQESSPAQATLGKRAMGLVVTDMNGQRLSFGHATGRYFAKMLSVLTCCVGYLMILFTQKKQGLHDIVAKTVVIGRR